MFGLDNLATPSDLKKWPHLKDIYMPKLDANEVHLLIGQDTPDLTFQRRHEGESLASRTLVSLHALGWIMNGPIGQDKLTGLSSSDRKALDTWNDSVKLVNHHYTMDIPFKDRPPNLPDNRPLAEHRLRLLGKQASEEPRVIWKVTASMHELLDRGYAEAVTDENLKGRDGYTWYLPHHPVLHPRKPDKCRLVYDCAAKYRGVSLNDKVHQGPDLTNGLVGVLLRFRQEPIALMADIEGMFHQVRVSEGDRDALRFLWWRNDDPNETPMTYRMTAHLSLVECGRPVVRILP
ncbi:hypothetical protein QZH41_018115 [Actinostola sp. cb2023]|nr:hypothetical protein QZH41_018115 [Actinostola sp. cb2023]